MKYVVLGIIVLLLSGCKTTLYSDLPQQEANSMLALLLLHHIDADTQAEDKGSSVTLRVDKKTFVNAMEVLRQNGYPRAPYPTLEQMFPSDQLVTSPEQEKARLNYLQQQGLEHMLGAINGVISARVAIAESADNGGLPAPVVKSVSVYIKYSPNVNVPDYRSQIEGLIQSSVTGVSYDHINLFLQAADFRYQSLNISNQAASSHEITLPRFLKPYQNGIIAAIGGILLLIVIGFIIGVWKRIRES